MTEENTTNDVLAEDKAVVSESTETDAKGKTAKTKTRVRRKTAKAVREVARGRAYIKTSYNNTIVTFTDLEGNALAWSSSGHKGFAGPKKATPYAAAQVVRDVAEKAKVYGLREVFVYVRGIGSGRESAIRTLNAAGLQIIGIKDITAMPHNGPRAPKPRRI